MKEQAVILEGQILKFRGIKRAVESADRKCDNWREIAYQFLEEYAREHESFMGEDVRKASKGIVPDPPNLRAWGGIISRAKNNNLIEHSGYGQVSNPTSHSANASIWRSLIFNNYKQLKLL